jgi:hypothetical protein
MTIIQASKLIVSDYEKILISSFSNSSNSKHKDNLIHLISMCQTISNSSSDTSSKFYMTEDKVSRWLGFIQGIMTTLNLFSVDSERNKTRDLFHQSYIDSNIPIPPSIDAILFDSSFL